MDRIEYAILKRPLKHDIIVYRYDFTPEYRRNKFQSTSVTQKGTIVGKPNTAIIVPKESNGAYIEKLSYEDCKE